MATRASRTPSISTTLLPVPRTAPAIAAASAAAPATVLGTSISTTAVIPRVIRAMTLPTWPATDSASVRRATAATSAPATNTSRSAISTTTVAAETPEDACLSSHDRGCTTTSRVSVRAAAVTTSTRAADHHDGCTTTGPSRWSTATDRRASNHSESTATGRSSSSATWSSIAASAAADTAVSATTSAPQHNRRMAPGPASITARCGLTGVGSRRLEPVARHRHR
ncbi:Uncharacterised protein [Mycobacterium tuberculosis]|nr:Uncharacterised protein [Mycobacterium tuberculosis]